ncbi:MAG: Nif11-like leader peptide family natural product precursor [Acidihalobacter sp.]|jgi:hypothetical protein|uniref:Nif11-like leader peptide family natural product precursor n=1 Tax=Acidihalobacter sp. TaxID=1872108 RepID=UPI00307E5BE4
MIKSALDRDQQSRAFEKPIKQFGELVVADPALLDRLDEAPDKDSFVDLYCGLAADRGIHFSRDEMLVAVQEQKHGSNWVIPNVVLRMIAERF